MLRRQVLLAAASVAQRSTPALSPPPPQRMFKLLSSSLTSLLAGIGLSSSSMGARNTLAAAVPPAAAAPANDGQAPRVKRARKAAVKPEPEQAAAATTTAPGALVDGAPSAVAGTPASTLPVKRKKAAKAVSPSQVTMISLSQLQEKGEKIAELLGKLYPEPPIPLDHASHFQLLCAVLLSAQTTDVAVNKCTPALFALAPDAASMAALEVDQIATCIRTLGLAPTKAKNLKALSQMLVERHGGQVPEGFEALEALPGVGHKTASVVMAQAFGHDAFPVDTHIHRLAQRWGLTPAGRSVEQTEADLKAVFPSRLWNSLHLQIIYFGREMCPAKGHDPTACPICSWAAVPPFDRPGASPAKANGKGGSGGAKRSGATAGGARKASAAAAKLAATADIASVDAAPAPKRGRKRATSAAETDS